MSTAVCPAALLCNRQRRRIEPRDASLRPDDERQRESIPVTVVERLPCAAIVTADVGAVGAGGDPCLDRLAPLHSGSIAMRQDGGGCPCPAAIARRCGSCACA